jgi:hypothetical protein
LRNGLPSRPTLIQQTVKVEGELGHGAFMSYLNDHFYPCAPLPRTDEAADAQDPVRCRKSQDSDRIDIAIVGDSHGESIFPGLAEKLTGTNVIYYAKRGLPFLSDEGFRKILERVIGDPDIRVVILSAYWSLRQEHNDVPKGTTLEIELAKSVDALLAAGKTVYIADDVPDFPFPPRKCKYERSVVNANLCVEPRELFDRDNQSFMPALESIQKARPNVRLLPTGKYFCDAEHCKMARDGQLMFRDDNHLTIPGSRYLADRIIEDNPSLAQ